jgi:hypothetical protein
MLGEHRLSSEESDVENEVEQVLHIKHVVWHCSIECELDFLDLQCIVDVDMFAPQGSQLMKRMHASGNQVISRGAMKGLP